MYRVSGFICFLKHTISMTIELLHVIVNDPIGANKPDNNEFLGKSPTITKYPNYIIVSIMQ